MPRTEPLHQLTVRAIVLGVVLSAVLAGANAYLGLFAGLTVSASIPAAVISMAILKMFHDSNILENNIVQTAASAGEALIGIALAVPIVVSGEQDVLALGSGLPVWIGILVVAGIATSLYRIAARQ